MPKRIIALISESLHWSAERQTNISQVIIAALGRACFSEAESIGGKLAGFQELVLMIEWENL